MKRQIPMLQLEGKLKKSDFRGRQVKEGLLKLSGLVGFFFFKDEGELWVTLGWREENLHEALNIYEQQVSLRQRFKQNKTASGGRGERTA